MPVILFINIYKHSGCESELSYYCEGFKQHIINCFQEIPNKNKNTDSALFYVFILKNFITRNSKDIIREKVEEK